MVAMKELNDFWETLKNSEVKLKDVDKLGNLLFKVSLQIKELEKSRDKWKEKATTGSIKKIDEWANFHLYYNPETNQFEEDGIKIPIDKLKAKFVSIMEMKGKKK